MPKAVLATRNAGKIAELRAILKDTRLELLGPEDVDFPDVEETGETFEENALAKARAVSRHTGLAAIADDSGLDVSALGGAPGVRSARYAGYEHSDSANIAKLLGELAGLPDERRVARFVCVAAYVDPAGATIIASGTCEGRIVTEPRGAGGFGYDPVFVPEGHERTMAELPPEQKNAISHRGRAFRALRDQLRAAGVLL